MQSLLFQKRYLNLWRHGLHRSLQVMVKITSFTQTTIACDKHFISLIGPKGMKSSCASVVPKDLKNYIFLESRK